MGLLLAHRLRRWPNIKQTLFQCVVFAGYGLDQGPSLLISDLTYMSLYVDFVLILPTLLVMLIIDRFIDKLSAL